MKEYYIYNLQSEFILFFKQYPNLIHELARKTNTDFAKVQHNTMFNSCLETNQLINNKFKFRKDYTYYNKTHYLYNEITGAKCLVKVYPYYIYIYCTEHFNILVNIILQSNINYVILKK